MSTSLRSRLVTHALWMSKILWAMMLLINSPGKMMFRFSNHFFALLCFCWVLNDCQPVRCA